MRFLLLALLLFASPSQDSYQVRKNHPRIFIEDAKTLRRNCAGPLAADYKVVRQRADAAVKNGKVRYIDNKWAVPEDLMNCAIAWHVEGDRKYVDLILRTWGDGSLISNKASSNFGYHALAYDWIFDALSKDQRKTYGDALGSWLRYFTNKPEILLKYGHWEYNQTWGPSHLNVMNARDAITPKLFVALAILGAGTKYEADAKTFLDSWHKRIPAECIPAFNRMGGVWSESYGHGAYGPVVVIPYAFHAWKTATGIDLLKEVKPWGYPVESPRWVAYTMMPHNERTAWIDDGSGTRPSAMSAAAPMLRSPLAQWFSDRAFGRGKWQRVSSYDPKIKAKGPEGLPLGYLFPGAGHVYMRSSWKDPNATWAFFGCGPQFGGHSRDDEGHFLICKKGSLVSRQGGQGHNDDDYYAAGSLIYNILTIYDPDEKFRRTKKNENDGGLIRNVYRGGPWPRERGKIVAFEHTKDYTYAAADITKGYRDTKAREVTRQFLYLRGKKEFIIVFDRVTATRPDFKRHFFLHVPTKPEGEAPLTWLSLPGADGDRQVLSSGRSRMFLHTLLPKKAKIFVRDKAAWGHPLNPDAQYDHDSAKRNRPPVTPYRIEVGDEAGGARSLFLHVFEITDEKTKRPTPVTFVAPAGVDVGNWKIRFNEKGAPGGRVGKTRLATKVDTSGQYE